ncbi:MAG: SDR family oxidoreductase [Microbacteriaceae bacterium]
MTDSLIHNPWSPLPGSLVVVTGAAGGLGRKMTERLLEIGAVVLASDLNASALETLASDLQNDRLLTATADVTSRESLRALGERVRQSGYRLALWVNNAGLGFHQDSDKVTDEEYDRVFDVNLRSTLLGSQVAHDLFVEQATPGSIVNLSSVMGTTVLRRRSMYGTAKAAIIHLTKYLAEEWGEKGIRVNAIAPGFVLTAMSHLAKASSEEIAETTEQIALRRLGSTDDIAKMVLLLGSDLTGYQTGQLQVIDGGLTLTS